MKKHASCALFLILLFALPWSGARARPAMPFGAWSSDTGRIVTSCPPGMACSGIIDENNFMQRYVTDPFGTTYIQTVLAEGQSLSAESFVQVTGSDTLQSGIDNRQSISELTNNPLDGSTGIFESTSDISVGWADSVSTANMSQSLSEFTPTARPDTSDYWEFFQFQANYDAQGNTTGQALDVSQTLSQPVHADQWYSYGTQCWVSTCPSDAKDTQVYVLRQRGGDMQPTAGSITNTAGSTMSWAAGDTIRASWTGQLMNHTKYLLQYDPSYYPLGFEMLATSIETYDNVGDGQTPIMQMGYGDPSHSLWDPAFGIAPRMPQPVVGVTTPSMGSGMSMSMGMGGGTTSLPAVSGSVAGGLVASNDTFVDMWVPFDNWSATAGTIDWACPAGFACDMALVGEGFMQRNLTRLDTGESYVQTAITDANATGSSNTLAFTSESLVRMGNGGSDGIAVRQAMRDNNLGSMESVAQIRTGWADQAGSPTVDLTQNLSSLGEFNVNTNIAMGFHYASNNDAAGNLTGFSLDIRQYDIGSASLNADRAMLTRPYDVGAFVRRETAGDMLATAGSAQGGPSASTVSWQPGDDVQVTWIGQYFSWNEGAGADRYSSFWYQTYDNVSDSQNPSSDSNYFGGPGPNSWDTTTFGAQPTMP